MAKEKLFKKMCGPLNIYILIIYLDANVFLLIHTSFNKQQIQSKKCIVQFHHCVSV